MSAPPSGWASALELCEHVLKNEQDVTASINDLYAVAEKAKDRGAVILLQWFVTEQMEEEAAARAVLGRIRLAGNSGIGLLMIDQELATGRVPGMPVEGGPGASAVEGLMAVHRWNRRARRRRSRSARCARSSKSLGYRVARYVYPPGTVFPDHTHGVDKIDAVVSGQFRLVIGGHVALLGPGDWVDRAARRRPQRRGAGRRTGRVARRDQDRREPARMKIAVVGAGGVGGYFGARLAGAGEDVHFIARGCAARRAAVCRSSSRQPEGRLCTCRACRRPTTRASRVPSMSCSSP